ncbi:MAG: hypothetical protein WCE83_10440 [Candidatus Baltobacteraceae bacterium]
MTHAEVVAELADIQAGLDEMELAFIWSAAVFGWKAPARLEPRVERLRVLRDRVGREAAARKRGAA